MITILTLVIIFRECESAYLMDDPDIISFSRHLSQYDRKSMGAFNGAEQSFWLSYTAIINDTPSEIPPEVGSFFARGVYLTEDDEEISEELQLHTCSDVVPEEHREILLEEAEEFIKAFRCIDPDDWNISTYIDGFSVEKQRF